MELPEENQARMIHPADSRWLAGCGLNLQAVFDLNTLPAGLIAPEECTGFRQLLLFGNGGGTFWQALGRAGMQGEHPVDRFSVACVARYMRETLPEHCYRLLYPGVTVIPLQTLGKLAGWHHPSPMMVGINAEWGVWFAYRVALLADTELTPTVPWTAPSPCNDCGKRPCVSACPAGALDSGSLQLERCLAYRRREDSRCRLTCLARETCPAGAAHRYSDQQLRYHYGRSMAVIASDGKGSRG